MFIFYRKIKFVNLEKYVIVWFCVINEYVKVNRVLNQFKIFLFLLNILIDYDILEIEYNVVRKMRKINLFNDENWNYLIYFFIFIMVNGYIFFEVIELFIKEIILYWDIFVLSLLFLFFEKCMIYNVFNLERDELGNNFVFSIRNCVLY